MLGWLKSSHHSQSQPSAALWVCFCPSQSSGSSLGVLLGVGISLCHTDCHSCSRAVSTSLLLTQPQSKQNHPALLLLVLLQPPALLPRSDKEQPGQREGKTCFFLNNRGFCNTLTCEAANTRKGQNSVKPLWPPEADKSFTTDSVGAVWGKPTHCLCSSGYFMSKQDV